MTSSVLYLTADGILQPLGFSQVARVVEGLASRGFDYEIASLERAEDLANTPRLEAVTRRLARAGVRWRWARFDAGGGGFRAAANMSRLVALAEAATSARRPHVVHARAYHGSAVAHLLLTARRIPYLFDARSYWVDERHEAGQLARPGVYELAKRVERGLFGSAAGAVTLTELQASDLRSGEFGPWKERPLTAIPTCADFADFDLLERGEIAPDLRAFAANRMTLGFVGSINASYRLDRSCMLARRVLELRKDSVVVALTSEAESYRRIFEEHRIPLDRVMIRRVEHEEMARWVGGLDWGCLILKTSPSKRASMPTKLAEFFAAGVRPVHHGCNEEVSEWVRKTGSGISLPDLSDETIESAAVTIATSSREHAVLSRAREIAEPWFGLEGGIDRYRTILSALAS